MCSFPLQQAQLPSNNHPEMAFSYTPWLAEVSNPTSISFSFLTQTQPMEPSLSSSSSSFTSPSQFHLDFQQPLPQQQQGSPSPRTLQGPRPPRLKVDKNSHKIKKPPAWPAAAARPLPPPPQPQPVIIYTITPKVIRTNPSDFMSLVQRLTGCNSAATAVDAAFPSPGGAPSPVAMVAIQNVQKLPEHVSMQRTPAEDLTVIDEGGRTVGAPHLAASSVGILSPTPAALPPVSPHLFSTPAAAPELNSLGFLQEMMTHMSPAAGGPFLHSPLGFPITPTAPSPGWDLSIMNSPQLYMDLFSQFSDL